MIPFTICSEAGSPASRASTDALERDLVELEHVLLLAKQNNGHAPQPTAAEHQSPVRAVGGWSQPDTTHCGAHLFIGHHELRGPGDLAAMDDGRITLAREHGERPGKDLQTRVVRLESERTLGELAAQRRRPRVP